MTVATCLALFGWYVMYSNKEASQKPHLTSWHSLVCISVQRQYIDREFSSKFESGCEPGVRALDAREFERDTEQVLRLFRRLSIVAKSETGNSRYLRYLSRERNARRGTVRRGQVGMVAIVGFVGLDVVGMLALHPDFGVLRTNKTVRTAHKYGGRVVMATGYAACVMGFNKMNPNQIHQAAFGAPLAIAALVLLR